MFKKKDNKIKVAVGLSGGVDSSVAAYLLKEQGYDVTGVYIQCWDEKSDGCAADEDRVFAVATASQLGIRFKALNFVKEYNDKVISYFFDEYRAGRTPNPDIMCNKEIKFGMFLDWAEKKGFDFVATGHYARVNHTPTGSVLLKGVDQGKDQSYFLYRLTQKQLSKALFPIGGMQKSEVREIAKQQSLKTYNRPDSQGICFIGKVNIKDFLRREINPQPGKVFHVDGSEVGTHEGVWFYTIGQRHGFKIDKYYGLPLYVTAKRVEQNELVVGFAKDVLKKEFDVTDFNWISGSFPIDSTRDKELNCDVRIRHLGKLHKASAEGNEDKLHVVMQSESFGIAQGQSAVFYDEDLVLGGGIIS